MPDVTPALRYCFGCGTEKPVDEFSKSKPNRCRDCVATAARGRYQDARVQARVRAASKARYHAHREEANAQAHEYNRTTKEAALRIYGSACAVCGSTQDLEFDHVQGDGAAHRKREGNQTMLRRIARTGARLTDVELQLLCITHHREKSSAERRARCATK